MNQNKLITFLPYKKNKVTLITSGKPFFTRLLQMIEGAKHLIHIQFYIFDLDATGKVVMQALEDAAARGVQVFIVVDGYASEHITPEFISNSSHKNIYIKQFSPINSGNWFRVGRRLHHKIVWVDYNYALLGGINIADKYSGYNGKEPWLDFAVEVSGPILNDIKNVCEEVLPKKWLRQAYPFVHKPMYHHLNETSRITRNDWLRGRVEISASYRQAIRRANKSITIVASYFLPGNRMLRLIRKATEKGVHVKVILGGYSDVPIVKSAMLYLYDWMLRNNITIYEWNKSILHGKLLLVDHNWVTIGSYNLNALSDYGSLEMNVDIAGDEFAQSTERMIDNLIANGCEPVDMNTVKQNRNLLLRAYRWMSYHLIRASLLFMLYLMQKAKSMRTNYH